MTVFIHGALLVGVSVTLTLATIHLARRFNWGGDTGGGVQRFHSHWVARLGGIPIAACFVAWLFVGVEAFNATTAALWALCLLPAFAAGLIEDLHGNARPLSRLVMTMAGAALAWLVLDMRVTRLGPEFIEDMLLAMPVLSFLLTVLFVGGTAHAFNIIDGYNGLAGSYALVVLTAILAIAIDVADTALIQLTIGAIAATLGFFVLNFPYGRIFLGDGGSYFLGTLMSFLLVTLVMRHPEVSPWFAALLLGYPVWETLFSMYRKIRLRGQSAMQPDGLHLHMLIYKRLVRTVRPDLSGQQKILLNSATTFYTLLISLSAAVPAVVFWDQTLVLLQFSALFIAGYLSLYAGLVRFRMPRAVKLRRIYKGEYAHRAAPQSAAEIDEASFSAK